MDRSVAQSWVSFLNPAYVLRNCGLYSTVKGIDAATSPVSLSR